MWIEVFKTGTHQDAEGREKAWTNEDLDQIVNSYDPKEHQAPVVLGHPKDDTPAYGWVAELKREGDLLKARLIKVSAKLKEWVNQGRYQKRSISLYGDLSLRHVGFLGAQPPAVKGLKDFSFSDEGEIFSFEERVQPASPEEVLNEIIEAQKVEIERLKQALEMRTASNHDSLEEAELEAPAEAEMQETETEDEEGKAEAELTLEEQLRALAQRLSELEEPKKEEESEKADFSEARPAVQIETEMALALAQGRILPSWQAPLSGLFQNLGQLPQDFSEGATDPKAQLWSFVDGLKAQGIYESLDLTKLPQPLTEEERAVKLGQEIAQSTGMM